MYIHTSTHTHIYIYIYIYAQTYIFDLKFGPIVAGSSSPTRTLRKFIDFLQQSFLLKIKSYIKDNKVFETPCKQKSIQPNSNSHLTSQTYIAISPIN